MPTTAKKKSPPKRKRSTTRRGRLSPITEGHVTSYDGTRIWYQSQGSGTPIIFCNGLGCSTFYWKHIHAYFKKTHQVVLFDWRGHGQSELPKNSKDISVDALTEDLNAVIKVLNIKKAILAGHSMGTQIVYRFYQKYPNRVKALIPCFGTFANPIDTFYNSSNAKHIFKAIYSFNHLFPNLANKVSYLLSKNPLWFQMGSLLKMMNPGLVDKKVLKEYIEHFTSVDSVFLSKLAKSMQHYNAETLLKKIKVPTMIIAAAEDTFTPVWLSKKMHHLIPESEILIIQKASHVALIEQPDLINLRIEKFLQERL